MLTPEQIREIVAHVAKEMGDKNEWPIDGATFAIALRLSPGYGRDIARLSVAPSFPFVAGVDMRDMDEPRDPSLIIFRRKPGI